MRFSLRSVHPVQAAQYFIIDEVLGVIKLSQSIDRENLCPYRPECLVTLDVTVKPNQYFRILKVTVDVLDLNDNGPSFNQDKISLEVPLSSPAGTSFNLLSAEDIDSGSFGVQSYVLLDRSNRFDLEVIDLFDGSSDIRLKLSSRLDVEDPPRTSYSMTVVATDGGTPPRSALLVVDVVVLDTGADGSPRFQNATYETVLTEHAPRDTVILQLHAVDTKRNPATQFKYDFTDTTEKEFGGLFRVNQLTGSVYVIGDVDYEQFQVISLVVSASDLGLQGRKGLRAAFAKVTIHVLDINDNRPVITVNVLDCVGCQVAQVILAV